MPLPPALQTAPFTVLDADAYGVSRSRLQAGDLGRVFRGVRIPLSLTEGVDDERKFALLCDAYQAKLPPGWFFSSVTAARIIGVPVPAALEKLEVHVSSPVPHERPRGRRVQGHSAPGASVALMFGRPIRDPAELWCELASVLTLDQLIVAGDRLLSERPVRVATTSGLVAALRKHQGRRGAKKLREALPQLREHVWSPKETWVRLVVLRAGLPEPESNKPIHDRNGRLVAIGDLVLEKYMTLIEYEGERWHGEDRSAIDVDRFNTLSALGWTIVRVRKHHSAADVERMVREALLANA